MTNQIPEMTPQELFALHQGLEPAARPQTIEKGVRHPQPGLPVPHPPEYPAGNDEQRTFEQYYRGFWRTKVWDVDLSGSPAVGARIATNWQDSLLRFPARAVIVDNLSAYTFLLYIGNERIVIGPAIYNFIRPLPSTPGEIFLLVFGTGAANPCILTFTEEPLAPNPGTPSSSGGIAAAVNVSQFGGSAVSVGQTLMASSLPVTIASNQSALPVTIGAPVTIAGGSSIAAVGTGNLATSAGTVAAGSVTCGANRATKSVMTIRSRSTNNATGLTFPGGAIMFPGDSVTLPYTQAITLTGTNTDVVDIWEVY